MTKSQPKILWRAEVDGLFAASTITDFSNQQRIEMPWYFDRDEWLVGFAMLADSDSGYALIRVTRLENREGLAFELVSTIEGTGVSKWRSMVERIESVGIPFLNKNSLADDADFEEEPRSMADPIADFVTRLRNATAALMPEAEVGSSKLKEQIAQILKDEGYIRDYRLEEGRTGKVLVVSMKYGPDRERSLVGLKRVSRPGLRVYAKSTNLPRVLGGLGVAIISTGSGVMTDRQAARYGEGGEILAYVW